MSVSIKLILRQGAEPIYLHVLRPLVKPYTEALDALLELVQQSGDILFLLCAIPLHLVTSVYSTVYNTVYRRWILREKPTVSAEEPETPTDEQETGVSEFGQTRARRNVLHNAHIRATAAQPSTPTPQVWHPPPSAYDDSPSSHPAGLPTPPAEDQHFYARTQHVDEWRQYEAFPSAYPTTPPSRTSGLPPMYPSLHSTLDGLPGNRSDQPGFYRSLPSPRESHNPDSDGDLSDDHHEHPGVHTDDGMSVDEEYEEEEDDFNVTLRTPYPLSRIMNVSAMTATSEDESQADDSTGLSTIDYGSPLQTRTNSEASTYDQSDASSTASRKRPLPPSLRATQTTRPVIRERSSTQDTIRARPPLVRPSIRAPLVSRTQSKEGESSSGDVGKEDAEEVIKKRRVEIKTNGRKAQARQPLAKQGENKLPPRKVSASGAPASRPATKVAPKTVAGRPVARTLSTKESATET